MLKLEHLEEARNVALSYKAHKEQLEQLNNEDKLTISFGTRTVHINKDDHRLDSIKAGMVAFLQLRIDNCVRRANQIGLLLEPVVVQKLQTKSDIIKEYADKHGLAVVDVPLSKPSVIERLIDEDKNLGPDSWREEANRIFKQ